MRGHRTGIEERLLRLAERALPPEHRTWTQAMRAELAYVEPGRARLGFAAGCLRAACAEWLGVFLRSNAPFAIGVGAGIPFILHASIDGSGAWPLIWPLLGGALAAASPRPEQGLPSWRWALRGSQAGAISALLFALTGAVLIWTMGEMPVTARLPILALGALCATFLSAVGGGAAAILVSGQRLG